MEGKVPFWGGGGKKKWPNFPNKRAKQGQRPIDAIAVGCNG